MDISSMTWTFTFIRCKRCCWLLFALFYWRSRIVFEIFNEKGFTKLYNFTWVCNFLREAKSIPYFCVSNPKRGIIIIRFHIIIIQFHIIIILYYNNTISYEFITFCAKRGPLHIVLCFGRETRFIIVRFHKSL